VVRRAGQANIRRRMSLGACNLALGHREIGPTSGMAHAALIESALEFGRDVDHWD
jgi:hypothetical protein